LADEDRGEVNAMVGLGKQGRCSGGAIRLWRSS
jgi:hypothetical protein